MVLTKLEKKAFDSVMEFRAKHGIMPTRDELAVLIYGETENGRQKAGYLLHRLQAKGCLKLGRQWRDITIT